MHNCPRQLAMQSCVLCSFVRCGTSNQIEKKRKKNHFKIIAASFATHNTPIYGLSSVPQINMIKQRKSITTIFEHVFLYLFFRASFHLKKVVINFLNLATFTFSNSVFHRMCKSSYGFHFICSLNKMK